MAFGQWETPIGGWDQEESLDIFWDSSFLAKSYGWLCPFNEGTISVSDLWQPQASRSSIWDPHNSWGPESSLSLTSQWVPSQTFSRPFIQCYATSLWCDSHTLPSKDGQTDTSAEWRCLLQLCKGSHVCFSCRRISLNSMRLPSKVVSERETDPPATYVVCLF